MSLRDQGVIKAIGAGINEWQRAQALAERGDFDLFLLAGRYTLLEQEALDSFLPLCQKRGIGIVLGGPYNSGILATGAKPGAFYNYSSSAAGHRRPGRRIEAVCKRHGVRLIEAALQFPLRILGRFGHPRRPAGGRSREQPRPARRRHSRVALGRPEGRGADAGGCADRLRPWRESPRRSGRITRYHARELQRCGGAAIRHWPQHCTR